MSKKNILGNNYIRSSQYRYKIEKYFEVIKNTAKYNKNF